MSGMSVEKEIVIGEITKSDTAVIRLMLRQYRGSQFFDFRQWYLTPEGEWVGTKKGITFNKDLIGEIIDAVLKLERFLMDE